MVFKRRVAFAVPVLAAALFIALLPGVRSAWPPKMREAIGNLIHRNLAQALQPQGGERVLPPPTRAMLALLRERGITAYGMSNMTRQDPLLSQRLIEGGWPIRPDRSAPWYVGFAVEPLPPACREVERRDEVLLARCS
jgi:hypothetical protein